MELEKFTFFWQGPLSQWHPSTFTVDGLTFNCAEQYMMYRKAQLFGDSDATKRILMSDNPKEQKKIGRGVRGFDLDTWNKNARGIVFHGNYAKFTQNETLRSCLFETEGTTLVEASPYDRIWGIGMREDDPRSKDRKTWQGTNWLGETLTKVRDKMLLDYRDPPSPCNGCRDLDECKESWGEGHHPPCHTPEDKHA